MWGVTVLWNDHPPVLAFPALSESSEAISKSSINGTSVHALPFLNPARRFRILSFKRDFSFCRQIATSDIPIPPDQSTGHRKPAREIQVKAEGSANCSVILPRRLVRNPPSELIRPYWPERPGHSEQSSDDRSPGSVSGAQVGSRLITPVSRSSKVRLYAPIGTPTKTI